MFVVLLILMALGLRSGLGVLVLCVVFGIVLEPEVVKVHERMRACSGVCAVTRLEGRRWSS